MIEDFFVRPEMDKKDKKSEKSSVRFNWRKTLRNKVPIITWLPHYTLHSLLHDLLAGFTVALTEIPQSIAYAGIAGLPLHYGLYSSFMGGFVYAIFGSCKAINMGATSLMALLIQSHVATLGLDASVFISFVGGIIILTLGLMHVGFVIEFFSYPVMAGFTSAAALTIASSQIKNLLGIPGQVNEFLESWEAVIKHIGETRKWDAVLGITSLLTLIFLKEMGNLSSVKNSSDTSTTKKLLKKSIFFIAMAKNAIVVILGILIAFVLVQDGHDYLKLTGHVDGGFPRFEVPPPLSDNFRSFTSTVKSLGISTAFIPLVAILETIAIAKVFSEGKTLDASQEMIALGLANLLGSFVLSMPVTGSFSRTAVNHASGAKTNMAAVFTGVIIIIALKLLTGTFYYIPKATLAAVIISAMFYLFDFHAFILLWKKNKLDFIPLLVTLFSCLFISLEYGILIGIATNLIYVLYSVARPVLNLEKLKLPNHAKEIYIVTPTTTLHFPAAEHLRTALLQCEVDRMVIFDGRNLERMDITVAKCLSDVAMKFESRDQKIFFINFKDSIERACKAVNKTMANYFRAGELDDLIGAECIR